MDGALQEKSLTANDTNGSFKNGWTDDEKRALAAVTFPLIEMQKAYGRQMNAKLIMQGWQIKFAGRFSIEQLLYALDKYTDRHDDFPSPSNLIDILEPEEPRVTEAQFIAAQKWQDRNNDWSQYTDAAETISRYRRQNDEKREVFQITCEKVKQLAASSVKRINQIAFDNQTKTEKENQCSPAH